MDFASLMTSQIAKSKPKPSTTTSSSSSSTPAPNKYIKRSDLESARQTAYHTTQANLTAQREAKKASKRLLEETSAAESQQREEKRRRLAEESRRRRMETEREEEVARRKRLGLPDLPEANPDDEEDAAGTGVGGDIKDPELRQRLREMGEPTSLFGESHRSRLRRYRRLTTVITDGPIPTTLRLVEEKDMKVPSTVPKDKEGREYLLRQLASYFTMVLREWDIALAKENNADTVAGKQAYTAMTQSRENMKPLFRKFEKDDIDETVLDPVIEIVKAAQERRYVDANDGYLRLSIGKAAWPIGVTMVGIHERSAREKLHGGERGHVMGDEVTRKFLQSIKRCLTFAQVRWPPEDIRQLMG